MPEEESHAKRQARLFERIAYPYSWFFRRQIRSYAESLAIGRSALPDPRGRRALDLGCGTGAFTAALKAEGWEVEGVDIAASMVAQARKRGLRCSVGDILGPLAFEDASFDLVAAAYVAHGLAKDDRLAFFREAARLSRGQVLFHDYSADRSLLISLVEAAEGGDYFNFIKTVQDELGSIFSSLRVIQVGKRAAWYLCSP